MKTHSDGLYVTLKHFVKDEDFGLKVGVSYASCGTDQLVEWMEDKWNKMLVFHFPT
jgi:hypothetical protein